MSDSRDEKLEAMLRSRRFEPSSPDLPERIILKAQSIPQNQTITGTNWVKGLFAEFHLPRPAYVLAGTLVLGFVVGLYTPSDTANGNSDNFNLQSFLYADEDVL